MESRINIISSPIVDLDTSYYILPETSPHPQRRELAEEHDYVEIDQYHDAAAADESRTYESMMSISPNTKRKNLAEFNQAATPTDYVHSVYSVTENN